MNKKEWIANCNGYEDSLEGKMRYSKYDRRILKLIILYILFAITISAILISNVILHNKHDSVIKKEFEDQMLIYKKTIQDQRQQMGFILSKCNCKGVVEVGSDNN